MNQVGVKGHCCSTGRQTKQLDILYSNYFLIVYSVQLGRCAAGSCLFGLVVSLITLNVFRIFGLKVFAVLDSAGVL